MRNRGRRGRIAATALGTIMVLITAGGWVTTPGPAAGPAAGQPAGGQRRAQPTLVHQVTLLTGDRVTLRTDSSGRPSVHVDRAPDRASVPYAIRATAGGHVYVEPADAHALIAADRLDERLFDITQLVTWGYDDAHADDIPVIVQADGGTASDVPFSRGTRKLPELGMSAGRIPKADAAAAWRELTAGAPLPTKLAATAANKIWLDGKMRVTDDVSAAQIGALAAWDRGLTGADVAVAVLDSGYDPAHPDLADVVTRSQGFTTAGESDVTDRHGHGTHVGSILAGSGAASDGRFQGVAPDANLAVGKVCDDTGSCDFSAVLAGMAWAAQTVRARVVNLSLGGADAPGIDPLEEAVNTLTEQTGTLFVVAAGNGGRESTIQSPGSADAALTVGAVNPSDVVTPFSSRGPRVADFAIKPDLTAPGVEITAAKAAGSQIGTPVGTAYQKLSGTSMATPHVAAAAAIMAQQHPDWTAGDLKAVLTSSTKPSTGQGAYQQGTGRLDVARAITQQVTAAPAGVSAFLPWPHPADQTATRSYSYTNHGSNPVTLALSVSATGGDGEAAPAGLFQLSENTVTVPPGATAPITVTVAAAGVSPGLYSGRITATSADGQVEVGTGVGAFVEPEAFEVSVSATGRDGLPNDTVVSFFDPVTGALTQATTAAGTATLRLAAKRYIVHASVFTQLPNGDSDVSGLLRPFTVGQNSNEVALDARSARPVSVTIDRGDAAATLNAMTAFNGQGGAFVGIASAGPGQVYVLPVQDPNVVFNAQSIWTREDATEDAPSPYRYDLADVVRDEVPADATFRHSTAELAAIETSWRAPDAPAIGSHVWAPVLPDVFLSLGTGIPMRLPAEQTEYVTPQVTYSRTLFYGDSAMNLLQGGFVSAPNIAYSAGNHTEAWNRAAAGPAFPQVGNDRNGDVLTFGGDGLFSDAVAGHVGRDGRATGTVQLRRGTSVVATAPLRGGFAALTATLPAAEATYELGVSARRTAADAGLSSAVNTVWTFRSARTPGRQALPLLAARFPVPGLDEGNEATPGATMSLPVQVVRNPGAPAASITELAVEVSADDGRTWRTAPVAPCCQGGAGEGWIATVTNPPAAGHVSLRATATDSAGSSVVQTIVRAYAVG